ncbi:MAG: YdeI/OmpD-associated family protein [Rhodobacter sp.]|nr:YdeI/OmpD-associated family protein [Rhodobacter sp.]
MITDIEDYFAKGCGRCARFATAECATGAWAPGLAALRRICRDMELVETVKWGHPCYRHAGRNIAIIGAFRGDFRLSFFNEALLKDPEGVLERQGPNSRYPDTIRFVRNAQVAEMDGVIRSYLQEAMGYAEQGVKPPKDSAEVVLPDELIDALDNDPDLAAAFHALTPGRQRSYAINLSSAKKPETRRARIAKFRDKILAGKGALER